MKDKSKKVKVFKKEGYELELRKHEVDGFEVDGDREVIHRDPPSGLLRRRHKLTIEKHWTPVEDIPTPKVGFRPPRGAKKLIIDRSDPFWKMLYRRKGLVPCFLVKDPNTGEEKLLRADNGREIGRATKPPSALAWSGPDKGEDEWRAYRISAEKAFQKMGLNFTSLGLPTPVEICDAVKEPAAEIYYAIAHGSSHIAEAHTASITSLDIEEAMIGRAPMIFAFLGHCGAMTQTEFGSFSHAFRRGGMEDTVTLGYHNIDQDPEGWRVSYQWQQYLFELLIDGEDIGTAFDVANERYPEIEDSVRLVGDDTIKIEGEEMELEMNFRMVRIPANDEDEEPKFLVYGKVIYFYDNSPIAGAEIRIEDSGKSTFSDSLGDYKIPDVNKGRHSINCSCQGYEPIDRIFTLR